MSEHPAPLMQCGAQPPYWVSYIDSEVCGTRTDQWFVMGTVDGDPRNQCGPVAVCEYEPSAHVIAGLLNESGGVWHREHVVNDTETCWCGPTIERVIPSARGDAR